MIFTVEVILFQYRIPVELRRLVLLYWYLPTVENKIIYDFLHAPDNVHWWKESSYSLTRLDKLFRLINQEEPYDDHTDENGIYCCQLSVLQHRWQSSPLWKQFREDYANVNIDVDFDDPCFEFWWSRNRIIIDVDREEEKED